jgi:ubiquinone/menaquinone biosynthesis C-methylase UbiE
MAGPVRQHVSDCAFSGSVPEIYDSLLVPLIFEPYAIDLASRAAARKPRRVLEIAAGTGVVTRQLAARLPAATAIVATDLNVPMLQRAAAVGTSRPVEWRQADALQLPFEDASFDVVVCQFGVMFVPDRPRAYAEAHRVLAPGGALLFNVWDRIEDNEFAETVVNALARLVPEDPPRFLVRTPYGYFERATIERDLRQGTFSATAEFETLTEHSRANSPSIPAIAYCQGTPLRGEIEQRGPGGLAAATQACTSALAERFGAAAVDGRIQAHVIAIAA